MHKIVFLFIALLTSTSHAANGMPDDTSGATSQSKIGYPSVSSALSAMKEKSGVEVSVKDGWTIIFDRAEQTLWSFTPDKHPAYPSVAKRAAVSDNGKLRVLTQIRCEAAKAACDQLATDFDQLNKKVFDYVNEQ